MDSFVFALTVVLPLFLLMAIGFLFRTKQIIGGRFISDANKLIFRFALPLLLFDNIYSAKILFGEYIDLISFTIIAICFLVLILMLTVPMLVKNGSHRGIIIQGLFRSNFVFLGLPLAMNMYGPEGIGATSAIIPIVIPLFNFFAVIVLNVFSQNKKQNILKNIIQVAQGVIANPLIIASFLAIIFVYCNVDLPTFIKQIISDVGKIATPLALIILGGNFTIKESIKNKTAIAWTTLGKLIIIPALMIVIAVLFGLRGQYLAVILAVFATPGAVSGYVMVHEGGGDSSLAGQLVVYSTAFCCITLFIFIFVLKELALI